MTFHYKQAPQGPLQYGLIAEEVAKIYPDLVTRNAKGEIEGVRYDELMPLLLNEMQQQQHQLAELKAQNEQLRAQSKAQQQDIVALQAANKSLQATLEEQNTTLAARVAQLEAATHIATVASR